MTLCLLFCFVMHTSNLQDLLDYSRGTVARKRRTTPTRIGESKAILVELVSLPFLSRKKVIKVLNNSPWIKRYNGGLGLVTG